MNNQHLGEKQLTPREIYALVRPVCKAGADPRPVLGCVLIDDGRLIASDGFRMYIIHHAPTWDDWAAIHFRGDDIPPNPLSPDLWPCAYPFINWVEPGARYPNYKAATDHPTQAVVEMPLDDVLAAIRHTYTLDLNVPFVDILFEGYPEKVEIGGGAMAVGNIARLSCPYLADALKHHRRHSNIVRFQALDVKCVRDKVVRIDTFGMTAYIMTMHIPAQRKDRPMQFQPELAALILEGRKTQTRRPVKLGDLSSTGADADTILWLTRCGRLKWRVGETYAVQPGRNKPSVARITLLRIRREDVRDISLSDALAEGFSNRRDFWRTWCEFYDPPMARFEMDALDIEHFWCRPDALYKSWALDFELVK